MTPGHTSRESSARRGSLELVLRVAFLASTAWLSALVPARAADEIPTAQFRAPGLSAPAEILIDRWGVPHLYAQSQDDAFFLQGWNAARDRLWQLDLWRRRGTGTLSEVLGPDYLEQDRAARLLLYRGDMHAEWLAYASDTKRIVTSFVMGINAFIGLTQSRPELRSPFFDALGYTPSRWSPEDVVRIRSHGLLRNVRSEVERARFVARHGLAAAAVRDRLTPTHALELPEGLDLASIPEDVLALYRTGTRGVTFPSAAQTEDAHDAEDAVATTAWTWADTGALGSNNWALAPQRTATGRPILADDPHRTQAVPSLRYITHISAPGLDIIGAGEPALPGVSIGHNGTIAFGLTIFSIDQEDLYVYETHPDDADLYRYRGRYEPVTTITETIAVRDREPVDVVLRFTRHGPILYEDPAGSRLFALRAAWLEPGMAPYLGSIEYMRARDWDEFLAAMNRWGAPSENQVFADTTGRIGWKPGGRAPIRPNWDGLLPVPGDGRYEWAGYYDMDQLPIEVDPERGFVASANQMNLPVGYPTPLGYEWAAPWRHQRIVEVLEQSAAHTITDSLELQGDHTSLPARRLLDILEQTDLLGPEASSPPSLTRSQKRALSMLEAWDGVLAASSAPAALFEIWWRNHLPAATWSAIAEQLHAAAPAPTSSGQELGEALTASASRENMLDLLANEFRSERNDVPGLDANERRLVLLGSLETAWQEASERLGKRPEEWQWGTLHRMELVHPTLHRLPTALAEAARLPSRPRGGSGETVGNTGYRGADYLQVSGASFRMVLDVGNWDASVAMNNPGQSGDPRSPHYNDLLTPWSKNEAFPLLYSRDKILESTSQRILLRP